MSQSSSPNGPASSSGDSIVSRHLQVSARVKLSTADVCGQVIVAAADLIAKCFKNGGKLLLCGNGGSAADCQHTAAEFTSRLSADFPRPALPAIALTTDTSFLTAYANDFDFDGVFVRQVQALGRPGDVLLAISTSGNSRNVLQAVEEARNLGMKTIGLTGGTGGKEPVGTIALQTNADTAPKPSPGKPSWDSRQLTFNGEVIKRLARSAPLQEAALSLFEAQGWIERIDARSFLDNAGHFKSRLHDVIGALNRHLKRIRFSSDGSGTGIHWAVLRPDQRAERRLPRMEKRATKRRRKS